MCQAAINAINNSLLLLLLLLILAITIVAEAIGTNASVYGAPATTVLLLLAAGIILLALAVAGGLHAKFVDLINCMRTNGAPSECVDHVNALKSQWNKLLADLALILISIIAIVWFSYIPWVPIPAMIALFITLFLAILLIFKMLHTLWVKINQCLI